MISSGLTFSLARLFLRCMWAPLSLSISAAAGVHGFATRFLSLLAWFLVGSIGLSILLGLAYWLWQFVPWFGG